jgi:hypothetical protein
MFTKKWWTVIGVFVVAWVIVAAALVAYRAKHPLQFVAAIPATPSPTPVSTPSPTPTPLTSAEHLAKANAYSPDLGDSSEVSKASEHLRSIPASAREYKEAQKLLKQFERRAVQIKRENDKAAADSALLGPKPENSAWNGTVRCVDKYLKATLNDYDSAEYVEWSPVVRMDLKGQPYWAVRLKLRATNAFGGKILKEAVFFIRNDQVVEAVGL